MIDQEITLTCTDNGKRVPAYVLAFKENVYMDVAVNTVRIKLSYHRGTYAGSMGGYEFTIKDSQLPKLSSGYSR
jgi:hypothetical protein